MKPELVKVERWKCTKCGMMHTTKSGALKCCTIIDIDFEDVIVKEIDFYYPSTYFKFSLSGTATVIITDLETHNIKVTFYFNEDDCQVVPTRKKDDLLYSEYDTDEVDTELEDYIFKNLKLFIGTTVRFGKNKIGKIS